ncbi:hypothetical protein HZ994_18165 [Akkermansiaceae bacterium]|nr:hypothetical protein HZ994_18165 [Akkermansiaceae bacterium]
MSLRGFLFRLIIILLLTWIIGSITESFWAGLYFAVVPFLFYEMVRLR